MITGLKRYWPLMSLIGIAALGALALIFGSQKGFHELMHYFMGLFLCQFAMLKIFNISGFADGFRMYDLLAKKFRIYAYLYPFIELSLGLAYLSFLCPLITYSLTLIIMIFSAIGVIKALRSGLNIRCACMGTVLDVPLSSVTLSEDIAMSIMAALMLLSNLV
jgi:hypothetical protein